MAKFTVKTQEMSFVTNRIGTSHPQICWDAVKPVYSNETHQDGPSQVLWHCSQRHWRLAVEQCGVAQLIEVETIMVSDALFHLQGKASMWVTMQLGQTAKRSCCDGSLKQRLVPFVGRRTTKCYFIRVCLGRDKFSDLYKTMFRRCARRRRLLV